MSHSLIIRHSAREDIEEAYTWYEAQRAGRGDEFMNELRDQLGEIRQAPDRYGRVHRQVRAATLPGSKYVVYFRIDQDQVTVLAVQHARANPRTGGGVSDEVSRVASSLSATLCAGIIGSENSMPMTRRNTAGGREGRVAQEGSGVR